MKPGVWGACWVQLLLLAAAALASDDAGVVEIPDAVRSYQLEYEEVRSRKRPTRGVEPLYHKALAAGEKLTTSESGKPSLLEQLSEDQMVALRRSLPGIFVNREESIAVYPDPEHFLRFAIDWGDRADIAYFAALRAASSSPGWPIYIDRQWDYGGCRRIGSFVFAEIYDMWLRFQRRFPDRYADDVAQRLRSIEREVLHPAACESADEVVEAYREFLRVFPDAPPSTKIRERIDAIARGESGMRFDQGLR